jgi:DNA-binding IclR family transcriptional regulator
MRSATDPEVEAGPFQAADRVLQMLLCFDAERKELGVSELADTLEIHRSTASRLAATLEVRAFLERVPGKKTYRLGPQMGRLGLHALGSRDLLTLARPIMERLAAETGETINLASVDGDRVVNLLQSDGGHLVGVGVWTGRRTPLHCVANGKVLVAFAGADPGPGPFERFTRRTITSARGLEAEAEKIRGQGYATNEGEIEEGLHAVAAPVFDAFDRCRAALSVSAPEFRLPSRRLPEVAGRCVAAARELSRALGANRHG